MKWLQVPPASEDTSVLVEHGAQPAGGGPGGSCGTLITLHLQLGAWIMSAAGFVPLMHQCCEVAGSEEGWGKSPPPQGPVSTKPSPQGLGAHGAITLGSE